MFGEDFFKDDKEEVVTAIIIIVLLCLFYESKNPNIWSMNIDNYHIIIMNHFLLRYWPSLSLLMIFCFRKQLCQFLQNISWQDGLIYTY